MPDAPTQAELADRWERRWGILAPAPAVPARKLPPHERTRHLDAHPLAERLPPLAGERLNGLRASILAYGQQDPIVLLPDDADNRTLKILDGRHRYLVAGELGLTPAFVLFDEVGFGGSPAEFVAMREQRRQMSRDQAACSAALQTDDLRRASSSSARSRAAAAAAYGVHDADIRRARELLSGDRDLFDAAFRGEPAPGESRPLTLSRGVSLMRRRRRAARTRAAAAAAAPLAPSAATLITGDAREALRALDVGSARLIFSDIPYNIGVDYGDGASADTLADEAYLDYWAGTLDAAAGGCQTLGNLAAHPDDGLIDASEATYAAVAPDYAAYVAADAALASDERSRRLRTLAAWRAALVSLGRDVPAHWSDADLSPPPEPIGGGW